MLKLLCILNAYLVSHSKVYMNMREIVLITNFWCGQTLNE